jgi:predicted CXXCH cytochrome family protein
VTKQIGRRSQVDSEDTGKEDNEMRSARWVFIMLVGAVVALGLAGAAYAFHSGGVAECTGCHSIHSPAPGGSFLLIQTDQSSTCLSCHQHAGDTGPSSYHISTAEADMPVGVAPLQRTPGGDFGWLKKTYTFTVRGNTITEEGQTHGHNIVAVDFGYVAEVAEEGDATAPGGTFLASQLGCQSCHDPHSTIRRLSDGSYTRGATQGQASAPIVGSGSYGAIPPALQAVGAYRLLRGINETHQGVTFPNAVAIAVVPSTYNRSEASTQTRTAYGANGTSTWGNWCATCHPGMHSSGNYVHPIDESLGTEIANNYNYYVKSGDFTGLATTSFTSLVPFMENTGDIATLASHAKNDNSYLNGPGSSDKVACLSCHRAHATGWENMLRWNMEGEFMVYNGMYPGTDNGAPVQFARGRTSAETQAAYYDRPVTQFASYQRVLCNKCHAKD